MSFVVAFENPASRYRPKLVEFMIDGENERTCLFSTAEEAREAVRGAMWEHAWAWWIIDLSYGGRVVYGTDLE